MRVRGCLKPPADVAVGCASESKGRPSGQPRWEPGVSRDLSIPNAPQAHHRPISLSFYCGDLSKSIPVGTRKMVNYA